MALTYSLGPGAPAGVVIDPATGIVTNNSVIPSGDYTIEVLVFDSDTGLTTVCENRSLNAIEITECEECLQGHLLDHPHLGVPEVQALIDAETHLTTVDVQTLIDNTVIETGLTEPQVTALIAQGLVDWIPPELPKDCTGKNVLSFSYCGKRFDMLDWSGNGRIDINLTPQKVAYTGDEPLAADAAISPVFNSTLQTEPEMPVVKFAGPPGEHGGLACITHMSDGCTWIPVCSGNSTATGDPCVLYAAGTIGFPFLYNASLTTWQVGAQTVRFAQCGLETATLCVGGSGVVVQAGGATTGATKPDFQQYLQNGDVLVSNQSVRGCNGSMPGALGGHIYTMNFHSWVGNNGNIELTNVQSITLSFDVQGSNVDIGVGLYDTGNSTNWQPVTSVTGPTFTQNADYIRVTGPGSYEIGFGIDPATLTVNSNTLEGLVFGLSGDETINNYRMVIVHNTEEPCGSINNAAELAANLTTADPNGHTWFVDTDGGITALMAPGLCELYRQPVFETGAGVEYCQISDQAFPVSYNPLTDGWVVNGDRILFAGTGIFQSADELAAWMTTNDPLSNLWSGVLQPSGNYNICSVIDPGVIPSYGFLTYDGANEFVCQLNSVAFPLGYTGNDGWVLNGELINYPAGTTWFTPDNLADWMTANDPNGNTWVVYVEDITAGTYNICAAVPDVNVYGGLTYDGTPEFCCQANNLQFPVNYNVNNDGWIVNNTLIPFAGDGVFIDAAEMVGFLNSNDPNGNTWAAYNGVLDSSNICGFVPDGECPNYGGMVLSEGNVYHCDTTVAFPYNYTQHFQGWEVNGNVIVFEGDGTFETPDEFVQWLTANDPNGYTWVYENTATINTYSFCAFMPASSAAAYNGIQNAPAGCNQLAHRFPYTYDSGAGWLVNNQIITYWSTHGPNQTFGTATQFAAWMTANDPNGYTWHIGQVNPNGDTIFCAVMPSGEETQYQGLYEGTLRCIADGTLTFPVNYAPPPGGARWVVDGVTHPMTGTIPQGQIFAQWASMTELLSWVQSTDTLGHVWFARDGNSICTYVRADNNPAVYEILRFS